jgi:hypothetical protein
MNLNRLMKMTCVLGLALTATATARAQTSYPFLFSLYPCGLKQGTSADISLSGLHNYHGAYKVLIQGQSVTGEVVVPKDGWPKANDKGVIPTLNNITIKVTAAPDAALGIREVRVATPRGVSSVGLIVIGDEKEAIEAEPNNSLDKAQAIEVGSTINGRIQDGEDVDTFKFKAEAGQEITFSVLCARLQDKIHDLQTHADPILTLRDMTGRELAATDDYYRADPLLSHKFKEAGEYVIQVRDVGYQGNPYWVYRLNVTRRPFVTALMPSGMKPGAASKVQAVGFNLGGDTAELAAPASLPMGDQCLQVKTAAGLSNPVPVLITDLPVRTRTAGIAEGQPDALVVSEAVSGRLAEKAKGHRYKITLKKGQTIAIQVDARRLDSQLDSYLSIQNAAGNILAENDDATGPDSHLDFAPSEAGDYFVEVRDLHDRAGPNFVYLLSVKPALPEFTIRCDDDKMKLCPGGGGAWYILVERKFGFNAPITVVAKGLPEGVTAAPLVIPPNVNHGCLILSCAPSAKVDCNFVEITGTATFNGADGKPVTLTQRATPMEEIYLPGGGRAPYPVGTHCVAVTEPSDILVELSTTKVELAPGGTAKIDVTIKRQNGFTKGLTLDVILRHLGSIYGNPLPPGITMDEGASKTLLGENETKGSIVFKAAADAQPVTDLPIAVLGQVSINFVVKVSYAGPPLLLTVTPKK